MLVLIVLGHGCAVHRDVRLDKEENVVVLLDPAAGIGSEWEHRVLRKGATDYAAVETSIGDVVRATGTVSASVLFRIFEELDETCSTLRWDWYVESPQPSSELRVKGMDDVAASIFVLFGDPGIFRDMRVPALKYVWANENHEIGDVIAGPYLEELVRTIVVQTGRPGENALLTESVNVFEDFEKAFGRSPENGIHGIGLFTDNDDTREAIKAYYGKVEVLCD